MKNLILTQLFLLSIQISFSQNCSPNSVWADTTEFGVIPDTTQNFPSAVQNQFYSTDLNFKVPSVVTAELAGDDPFAQGFIGSAINDFTVTSVDGLTATNLQYVCNIGSCTYSGGTNGCANIYGIPTQTGVFDVKINISANISLFGFPIAYPTSFSGYKIIVGTAGVIEQIISPITISPNPANELIKIEGITPSTKAHSVAIINLDGKVVVEKLLDDSLDVIFDLTDFKSGLYFVNVNHESGTETIRLIKN